MSGPPSGKFTSAGAAQSDHRELQLLADVHDLAAHGVVTSPADAPPRMLFTDNVSNAERLWGVASESKYTKDAFHRAVVQGDVGATNPMPIARIVASSMRAP